jgi:transposase
MARRQEILRALEQFGPRGRGRPYPRELQSKIAEYVRARRASGVPLKAISAELGVSWRMLSRWTSGGGPDRRFRRVELRAVAAAPKVVVHGPRGVHIEGLDLEQVAELLRKLA